ncbi:MAG: hypothetical protein M1837_007324 [Sclerophora amabilis]|nr:MAG: hypothetical protein M1837_007324 [Sclerophora amabilis]
MASTSSIPTLFTLPIAPSGSITSSGSLTCTVPAPKVYLLSFTSPPDNRLTPPFCDALLLALDILQLRHPSGVVVTTSGIQKFYSNGLDLEYAMKMEGFWENSLWPLYRRILTYVEKPRIPPVLLSLFRMSGRPKTSMADLRPTCRYPMPTVALMNGHAFAGGFMMAMHHDYRIFNPSRGFLCLNEVEFGASLHPPMASIFRQKLPSPLTYRSLVLEAKRFPAKDALADGLVDGLGGLDEVLKLVHEKRLVELGAKGSYGLLKAEMWRESIGYLEGHESDEQKKRRDLQADEEREEEAQRKVAAWETGQGKAKL